jgi:Fic family protein
MATYIHELKGRPRFRRGRTGLAERVAAVRHRQGRLIGRMEGLGLKLRTEATLRSLTEEVVKSSKIEGAVLDRDQVRWFYSMSAPIRQEQDAYYDILKPPRRAISKSRLGWRGFWAALIARSRAPRQF